MPTNQSDFLRALLEDDEDGETTVESGEPAAAESNKTMKQLRDTIKRLDNQVKKYEKENKDLSEFKDQILVKESTATVKSKFKEVFGDETEAEKNAKLFFRGVNDPSQVNDDAITEYLREFGPATPAAQPGDVQAPPVIAPSQGGLAPTPGGSAPVQGLVSSEDMVKMLSDGDFEGLAKAQEAGRLAKADYGWPTQARE